MPSPSTNAKAAMIAKVQVLLSLYFMLHIVMLLLSICSVNWNWSQNIAQWFMDLGCRSNRPGANHYSLAANGGD